MLSPPATGLRNGWLGYIDVLAAEQAALDGMRIERRDRDLRPFQTKATQRPVGEVDDVGQALRRQPLRHILKRDVRGDMADAHVAVRQHYHRTLDAGELGQDLSMAGMVIAGLVQEPVPKIS